MASSLKKRNREMKKLICMLLAVVSAFCCMSLAACGGDGKETLVVYTEAGFAPWEYIEGGKIVGADVDIMNLVGKELNMNVTFENVAFDVIVDTVKAGKLAKVGAAGLSITEDRQAKVDFSVPYYQANLYVIYQVSEAASYESETTDSVTGVYWEAFAGKKIGVQGGTTADLFLSDELDEGGILDGANATKTDFGALATAVADIGLNIDVVIIDELPAKELVKGNSNLKCAPLYYKGGEGESDEAAVDEYAIAVTKGETEILNAINKVLNQLLSEKDENGNNGVEKLVMAHLGVTA